MKAKKRKILKDLVTAHSELINTGKIEEALAALENLEKEVEVEELEELIHNIQRYWTRNKQVAQALKDKYKIIKREKKLK